MAEDKVVVIEDFNTLEKYIDEHISEIFDILRKEYLSKFINVADILIGDAVTTYEFPDYKPTIDKDGHMWYNTFNKWSWTKFENGVIKMTIEEAIKTIKEFISDLGASDIPIYADEREALEKLINIAETIRWMKVMGDYPNRYKINKEEWIVEEGIPFESVLDELYKVIKDDN